MAREPIGIVNHGNIGRTRSTRNDPDTGLPMEESIPSLRTAVMYDRDGNRLDVATHCHRAFVVGFDDKYGPRIIRDLLKEGFLEEGKCPHMPREQMNDQPSAPPPKWFATCDGRGTIFDDKGRIKPDPATWIGGCEHMRKLVLARREISAKRAAARKNPAGQAATLALAHTIAKQSSALVAAEAGRMKATDAAKVSG